MQIDILSPEDAADVLDDLSAILCDLVNDGESIGFLPPFSLDDAQQYWLGQIEAVAAGTQVLSVARMDGAVVGTGQLSFSWKPNSRHRAEVQKVLTHRDFRRRGVGYAMMTALEDEARRLNSSLLVLDTREGDPSHYLYRKCGYVRVGAIPNYARNPEGGLDATVFYYKILA